MTGWHVSVEVLVLRLLPDGGLGHRWLRHAVPTESSPDEHALALVGCTDGVCHSTSWRCERPRELVLTYAVLPDPAPHLPAAPLGESLVVAGGAALRPTPSELDAAHVAAHAVRHLADLAERDPVVRAQAGRDPLLWSALRAAAETAHHDLELAAS